MEKTTIRMERTYNAPVGKVWKALTEKELMKQWYFDLSEFRAEVGFQFEFSAGDDTRMYRHLCEVKEVIPGKKLAYSWRYEGYEGDSLVTFELFDEDGKTRLKLSHEGLESFHGDEFPELHPRNFNAGWTDILDKSLKAFLEN